MAREWGIYVVFVRVIVCVDGGPHGFTLSAPFRSVEIRRQADDPGRGITALRDVRSRNGAAAISRTLASSTLTTINASFQVRD